MEKIEKVIRNTRKTCICGGGIVETFVKKYGKSNGIIGPGYRTPSWVESVGFGCKSCGHQYGEPVFKKTKPTEQIIFELDLYVAKLKKKITTDDLHPLEKLVPSGKKDFQLAGKTVMLRTMKSIKSKAKVPKELQLLSAGTPIFISPNDLNLRDYTAIQLTKKKGTKTFQVKSSCIK